MKLIKQTLSTEKKKQKNKTKMFYELKKLATKGPRRNKQRWDQVVYYEVLKAPRGVKVKKKKKNQPPCSLQVTFLAAGPKEKTDNCIWLQSKQWF